MITFSLQSGRTGNFYRGHEPSNVSSNCWADQDDALVLTIEHARALAAAQHGGLNIVISVKAELTFTTDGYFFQRELFCAAGGDWYVFPHRCRLASMLKCDHHREGNKCKHCGAHWCNAAVGYWYDSITGRTLNEELKV